MGKEEEVGGRFVVLERSFDTSRGSISANNGRIVQKEFVWCTSRLFEG